MTKSKEQIFDDCAREGMIEYELKGFKRTYPRLFKVIMKAMDKHAEQTIKFNLIKPN